MTIENYLHSFLGSIGIQSQSIQMERQNKEQMVQQLKETRDNLSAVSLDEEMTDLIKYQHAFTAAAKLITSADQMMQALLDSK
jgi:flagellar hook-associated protein 1 FlgK